MVTIEKNGNTNKPVPATFITIHDKCEMATKNIYRRTTQKLKFEHWNKEISIRRLTWCGHLLRLPPNCPAQIVLKLLEEPTRSTRSNKPTWLQIIKNNYQA